METLQKLSRRPDPPTNIEGTIQKSIRFYIDTSLEEGVSVNSLKQDLTQLYNKEMLISRDMYCLATTELKKAHCSQSTVSNTMAVATVKKPKQPPSLFSPNTLYHASLCCHAVSTCRDEASVHRFFSEGQQHKLGQVSICQENSSEKLDRYLIARNGDTIYVAFRSEAKLSKWLEKYNTFENGIHSVTVGIIEQLQQFNIEILFLCFQVLKSKLETSL